MAKSITIFSNGNNKTYAVSDERYDIMVDRSRNILKEEKPKKATEFDEMNDDQILKQALNSPEYNGWNKQARHTAFSLDPCDDEDEYIPQDHNALLIDSSSSPEKESEDLYFKEHFEEIVHALLPRSEAEVYIRVTKYKMTYKQIGKDLGKSYNAVSKLYCKADKRLQRYDFNTLDDFFSSEQYTNPTPFKERGMKS